MSVTKPLQDIRHIALDLDGTVYTGEQAFDCAKPFLETLERLKIGYTFLTNNSSRSASDYVSHLCSMGIVTRENNIFTSGDATIEYLREEMPEVTRVFVLGTASLQAQFIKANYTLCGNHPDDAPGAVIVGYDMSLSYERLCRTAFWIEQGLPYIATHPDRICPTREKNVLVDCGSICAALETATGRSPEVVPGKPNRLMLRGILRQHGLEPNQLAMVGDRLYTDMAMAQASGALGVLVLTGETTIQHIDASEIAPNLVVKDLGELGNLLQTTWRIDNAEPPLPRHATPQIPTAIDRRHA